MKLKKPTTLSEVKEYDSEVRHRIIDLLKERMEVSFSNTTEEENNNLNKKKKMSISKKEIEYGKEMVMEGKIPSAMFNMPPIIFPKSSVESGVPYLNVHVTSWFNKKEPKTTYHRLLSLIDK